MTFKNIKSILLLSITVLSLISERSGICLMGVPTLKIRIVTIAEVRKSKQARGIDRKQNTSL